MKKTKYQWRFSIISIGLLLILTSSCTKENIIVPTPKIKASEIFSIGSNSVTIRSILKNNGESVIINQGICWSLTPNPIVKNSNAVGYLNDSIMFCRIEELTPNTKYHARVFVTSDVETSYGNEIVFTTNNTVTDVDGNLYNTVSIGTQVWMVENLKTTKYNDGTEMPVINTVWSELEPPSYCWYDFSVANKNKYGALYNWPAVISEKLCPSGWHVPTHSEWLSLIDYLEGENNAGGFLKSTGTNWNSPNLGATNFSGFCALPGGASSNVIGFFTGKGLFGKWWSSTIDYTYDVNNGFIIIEEMWNHHTITLKDRFLSRGGAQNFLSVRCIKDR